MGNLQCLASELLGGRQKKGTRACIHPSTRPLATHPSTHPSTHPPIHPSIHPASQSASSSHLFVRLSIRLSIHTSICPSVSHNAMQLVTREQTRLKSVDECMSSMSWPTRGIHATLMHDVASQHAVAHLRPCSISSLRPCSISIPPPMLHVHPSVHAPCPSHCPCSISIPPPMLHIDPTASSGISRECADIDLCPSERAR